MFSYITGKHVLAARSILLFTKRAALFAIEVTNANRIDGNELRDLNRNLLDIDGRRNGGRPAGQRRCNATPARRR
jgi:hypothetical protein